LAYHCHTETSSHSSDSTIPGLYPLSRSMVLAVIVFS
jgi:hypothetical protein